ncbi:MAG: DNA-processing protein DprA [Clostridia bacterium]|nr:DNA-processing protein DprA [Clostridia bacterium]
MELDQKERAWLWLSDSLGAAVTAAEKLIFRNDGLLPLFDAALKRGPVGFPDELKPKQRADLIAKASQSYIDSLISAYDKMGVACVTRDSEGYPRLLREIYDPPLLLFVKGRPLQQIPLPVAVIGARKCSDYGRQMAAYFGHELASHGACVVSGLAAGCDSAAANGALTAKSAAYPTVAVLGSGVDIAYPASSSALYEAIAERGSVVSELKPGTRPGKSTFPQRNRIISGMSKGVLVCEAGATSGTRITVDFAHEQGRDVFAVPGRLTDLMSVGTNGLIKSGAAKPVFGVDDILYEYGLFTVDSPPPVRRADTSKLSAPQRKLYELLLLGEKTADTLCEQSGFSASDVNMYLTDMELSGIIRQLPKGEYSL